MFSDKSKTVLAVLAILALFGVALARQQGASERDEVAKGGDGPRADDPLSYLFSKSDLIVAGEIVGEPSAEMTEDGVVHYSCTLNVFKVVKGKRPPRDEISVCITRFERAKDAPLPWIRKGGKCILFLAVAADKQPATFDWYFGSQPYNQMMVSDLEGMARKQATEKKVEHLEKGVRWKPLLSPRNRESEPPPLLPDAAPSPFPAGKSIETLSYSFWSGIPGLGPGGNLSIFTDGKVNYSHASAPSTGSGGVITQKEWALTKEERSKLFHKLVTDGLLDIPDSKNRFPGHSLTVSCGRWQFTIPTDKVPDKIMEHLRPLLVKAHPALWAEKKPVEKVEPPPKPVFTLFKYTFTPKVEGEEAALSVHRDGTVTYKRQTHPTSPGGRKVLVNEEWMIPAKDAVALLDALTADGLFDLENTLGGRIPNHHVHARAGRWHTTSFPKEMPEKLLKQFRPLLKKADADFWK